MSRVGSEVRVQVSGSDRQVASARGWGSTGSKSWIAATMADCGDVGKPADYLGVYGRVP